MSETAPTRREQPARSPMLAFYLRFAVLAGVELFVVLILLHLTPMRLHLPILVAACFPLLVAATLVLPRARRR